MLIGEEDTYFAGGSYVIVQKYLHDLPAWDALPVAEQETIVGRTKLSDLEFPDELKASNSHVALNTIVDEDGNERQIMRYNMPFGQGRGGRVRHLLHRLRCDPGGDRADAGEHVRRQARGQLRPHPRLLEAVTGALFFVPSADFLDDPQPAGAGAPAAAQAEAAANTPTPADSDAGGNQPSPPKARWRSAASRRLRP